VSFLLFPDGAIAKATQIHDTIEETFLAFNKGDQVIVTKQTESKLWQGYSNGRVGLFPYSLVRVHSFELPPTSPYAPLSALLFDDEDLRLALSLCGCLEISKVEKTMQMLIPLAIAHKKGLKLIDRCCRQEVAQTISLSTLFRRNSSSSVQMKLITKMMGGAYLNFILRPFIVDMCSSGKNFEIDKDKLPKKDKKTQQKQNIKNLKQGCENLLSRIVASLSSIPLVFRCICAILVSATSKKFPDSEKIVVSGFFFLRYICPAIVNPGSICPQLSPLQRRNLILVSKVLQNVANGVEFGLKENYLTPLNPFIRESQPLYHSFISSLSSFTFTPSSSTDPPSKRSRSQSKTESSGVVVSASCPNFPAVNGGWDDGDGDAAAKKRRDSSSDVSGGSFEEMEVALAESCPALSQQTAESHLLDLRTLMAQILGKMKPTLVPQEYFNEVKQVMGVTGDVTEDVTTKAKEEEIAEEEEIGEEEVGDVGGEEEARAKERKLRSFLGRESQRQLISLLSSVSTSDFAHSRLNSSPPPLPPLQGSGSKDKNSASGKRVARNMGKGGATPSSLPPPTATLPPPQTTPLPPPSSPNQPSLPAPLPVPLPPATSPTSSRSSSPRTLRPTSPRASRPSSPRSVRSGRAPHSPPRNRPPPPTASPPPPSSPNSLNSSNFTLPPVAQPPS